MVVHVRGRVVTTTTAGNLQHQFCQVVSDAGNTTIKAGSRMHLKRIA
jgi:hypothetical protein